MGNVYANNIRFNNRNVKKKHFIYFPFEVVVVEQFVLYTKVTQKGLSSKTKIIKNVQHLQ